jgi:hypothetical protein
MIGCIRSERLRKKRIDPEFFDIPVTAYSADHQRDEGDQQVVSAEEAVRAPSAQARHCGRCG